MSEPLRIEVIIPENVSPELQAMAACEHILLRHYWIGGKGPLRDIERERVTQWLHAKYGETMV